MKHRLGLTSLLLLWGLSVFALPPSEIALTVPLETDLAVPGIRDGQLVWLEMIRGAQNTLDIEQFYVSDQKGEALEPVLEEIRNAAARGVKVRLLADSKFFKTYPETITELGSRKGIESRTIDFSATDGVQHAKFFIVDGRDSIAGSHNFDWRALSHIHELGFRVKDPNVGADMERIFENDWAKGKKVGTSEGDFGQSVITAVGSEVDRDIRVVASPASMNPKGIGDTLTALETLFRNAKKTARAQVMTYQLKDPHGSGSWTRLNDAMVAAGKRGVKVQLMVDVGSAKSAKADLSSLAKAKNVEIRAVTIPAWSGGKIDYARLIHSKYLTVDGGHSWIGSENWSQGYFTASRNVGYVIDSTQVAGNLEQVFEKLWKSPFAATVK